MFSSKRATSGAQSSDAKANTWRKSVFGKPESAPNEIDSIEKGAIKATTVFSVEAERASLYKGDKSNIELV
jgi:hypothetical protein